MSALGRSEGLLGRGHCSIQAAPGEILDEINMSPKCGRGDEKDPACRCCAKIVRANNLATVFGYGCARFRSNMMVCSVQSAAKIAARLVGGDALGMRRAY